jgi:glucose-6-phosphate isomerase
MDIEITLAKQDSSIENKIESKKKDLEKAYKTLLNKDGAGNDFLGWVDLPIEIIEKEIKDIEDTAKEIRKSSEIFVVIGIGGSYLGARAVIESLKNSFDYINKKDSSPIVVYAGNTLCEDYIYDLMQVLDKKDYSLAVISKSGTTTEPAISFRIIREHLEKKYGKIEARKRIIAITDKEKGVLKDLANKEGYKTFVVPDNIGGRYSVLTPVGLLPISVAGFDIKKLILGAKEIRKEIIDEKDYNKNIAFQYILTRNLLYEKGKTVELLVNYQPNLVYISEWWKQLFGESEGKEGKGLFVASVSNTTDLHSMGQFIQEGTRCMFETVLHIKNSNNKIKIPFIEEDNDKLNYLLKYSLNDINHKAEEGTRLAHLEGGVSQIKIGIDRIDEENIGKLLYFFEFSCGVSGYMLGVNPFNQPGVENYKKKMFALLGKK